MMAVHLKQQTLRPMLGAHGPPKGPNDLPLLPAPSASRPLSPTPSQGGCRHTQAPLVHHHKQSWHHHVQSDRAHPGPLS